MQTRSVSIWKVIKTAIIGILALQNGVPVSAAEDCYGPDFGREVGGLSLRPYSAEEVATLNPACVYRGGSDFIMKGLFGPQLRDVFPPKGQDYPAVMVVGTKTGEKPRDSSLLIGIKRAANGTAVHIKKGVTLAPTCEKFTMCDERHGGQLGPSVNAREILAEAEGSADFIHQFFPRTVPGSISEVRNSEHMKAAKA